MFCSHCGKLLPGTAQFCTNCGTVVRTAQSVNHCLTCRHPLPPKLTICPVCQSVHQFCPQCGRLLLGSAQLCPSCNRVLKVPSDYHLIPGEYEHPAMHGANKGLRSNGVLRAFAENVSKKAGKQWYESTFNNIQVSEHQFSRLREVALVAARRLGLRSLPTIYIEADRAYSSATYGTEQESFVKIGSFMPRLLNDREMLFIIGHEFGHLMGGHALWTTASSFMFGEHRSRLMSDGILSYLDPVKLITDSVEGLITQWMQVADFTADRVGLLAVGDMEIARRTLLLLYLKNRAALTEINFSELLKQQEGLDETHSMMRKMARSATPYLGMRLRELERFYQSEQYLALEKRVESGSMVSLDEVINSDGYLNSMPESSFRKTVRVEKQGSGPVVHSKKRILRGKCPDCGKKLHITLTKPIGNDRMDVRCPSCHHQFSLNPRSGAVSRLPEDVSGNSRRNTLKVVKGKCPACGESFAVEYSRLGKKPCLQLQCRACGHRHKLSLKEPGNTEDLMPVMMDADSSQEV